MRAAYRARAHAASTRAALHIEAQSRLILGAVSDILALIVESIEYREASDRNTDVLNLQPIILSRLMSSLNSSRKANPEALRLNAADQLLNGQEVDAILLAISNVTASLMVAAGIRPKVVEPTYGWREEWEIQNQTSQAVEEAFGPDRGDPVGPAPGKGQW